jgi:hypothetical protein
VDTRPLHRRLWESRSSAAWLHLAATSLGIGAAVLALTTETFSELPGVLVPAVMLAAAAGIHLRPAKKPDMTQAKGSLRTGIHAPANGDAPAFLTRKGKPFRLDHEVLVSGVAIVGDQESGRSIQIASICHDAMRQDGGFIHLDGSNDPHWQLVLAGWAIRNGRRDDIVMFDRNPHLKASQTARGLHETSTIDILKGLSPEGQAKLILDLYASVGSDGAGVSKERILALLTCLTICLKSLGHGCALRYMSSIASFDRLVGVATDLDTPGHVLNAVKSYLEALPGYDASRGNRQSSFTMDQYASVETEVRSALSHAMETLGPMAAKGEEGMNLADLVRGRRIVLFTGIDRDVSRNLADLVMKVLETHFDMLRDAELGYVSKGPFLLAMEGCDRSAFDMARIMAARHPWTGMGVLAGFGSFDDIDEDAHLTGKPRLPVTTVGIMRTAYEPSGTEFRANQGLATSIFQSMAIDVGAPHLQHGTCIFVMPGKAMIRTLADMLPEVNPLNLKSLQPLGLRPLTVNLPERRLP